MKKDWHDYVFYFTKFNERREGIRDIKLYGKQDRILPFSITLVR